MALKFVIVVSCRGSRDCSFLPGSNRAAEMIVPVCGPGKSSGSTLQMVDIANNDSGVGSWGDSAHISPMIPTLDIFLSNNITKIWL